VTRELASVLPRGIIDTHVHPGPDVIERLHDDHELARLFRGAGYAGFVLKSHIEGTASRARLVRDHTWDGHVFGAIVLNRSVGGLNPSAVASALALGARIVWMPTLSAAAHVRQDDGFIAGTLAPMGYGVDRGIELSDADFDDKSALAEILHLVADADATLATGHLSPIEVLRLVPFARSCGVRRIVITHPELPTLNFSLDDQRELAAYGDVWFERCGVVLHPAIGVPIETIIAGIRATGPEWTILATDGGHPINDPLEGMVAYVTALLEAGITSDEIVQMAVHSPAAALGVAPGDEEE
jgi:hypothetical protein